MPHYELTFINPASRDGAWEAEAGGQALPGAGEGLLP
jgi:hypothetical protein